MKFERDTWNCEGGRMVPVTTNVPENTYVPFPIYAELRRQLAEAEAYAERCTEANRQAELDNDELRAKLALAEQQREIFKTAFLLMNEEYDPTDHLWGNGCWHGIKPARNCPSERCKDAAMHKAVDAALAAGEGKS